MRPEKKSVYLVLNSWTLALVTLLSASGVHAEKADSLKEMTIEADQFLNNGKTNVSTFSGDVVVVRGTLKVKAEKAVVTKSADEFQHVVLTAKPGAKISFRQKRDGGPDLWVEGESEKAEYDEKTEFVKFLSKAQIRYLDGSKVTQQQEGEFLSYDSKNDVFVGVNSSSGQSVSGGGRIKTTIQPRTEKQAN
ncbi:MULTISPECIES: lipopolysaccharide transport periplasmic protein LptA [Undibacterium]|jgi:lipopolysaccharide export system protein LptA|uniref:Lipopolysaccharide export system protein LptA n=2 Tax=Undibacterium TaxID=401469 RepID=A0ABS5GYJ3_9BURK|nr:MULTISPECIES: lipopolysaccharide transport periplasmic protein LptA [Undibacterium]MBC3810384.1 lipopolysaccharide transport periplasmic protein LptA [Undibacterium aquatile]MBC3878132.1 lipopolysaccharide transport periplasmic protein LptA [Undibacterium sp. FT79W]MBC3927136.1 lipopolysaccharide transport periplasmic protein LptA [Undibacterium sp. CY21W]MBK1888970.1 lipopolysaccharide transport periplasmic protein LptA [Undibacterium sp. 14-3-2]MBR7791503.1 lipopolysaccharide transport pe